MKKSLILLLAAAGLLFSCTPKPILQPGPYLGIIRIDSNDHTLDIPFNMNLSASPDGQWIMETTNAGETILLDELKVSNDTLYMRFPVFQSEILCRYTKDSLIGSYYPKGRGAGIAYQFLGVLGVRDRFPAFKEPSAFDVTGRWRITENPGTPDSNIMVGEFTQENDRVTGTILASGGDYRFLEGKVSGHQFMISAVDGAHSLIFTALVSPEGTLENGRFLGSPKWTSKWRAIRDETATLPTMDKVVWLKPDAVPFKFTFPDVTGTPVSLSDPKFKEKVVIVEAMGSWCPNCMDESLFLKNLYEKYKDQGLEIIGLCFEDKTFETSQPKMQRFIDQTGSGYTFLYAGPRGGESLRNVLYVADGMLAFPTTLYIDRKGTIRRIETGFSGPGTGTHYENLKAEITSFVEKLLAEGQKSN